MSRFLEVYEPVEEGLGNWLKNTYIELTSSDNNKFKASTVFESDRFRSSILKYISDLVKQKESGGKLTNNISLSKWDNNSKDYNERRKLVKFKDYVLCINLKLLNGTNAILDKVFVPMIPVEYKSLDGDQWYSRMEFFPVPLEDIIAKADKPRIDALKAAEQAIRKAANVPFVYRGKSMPPNEIFTFATNEYFYDDNIWNTKDCVDIATCVSYCQGYVDDYFGYKPDYDKYEDSETPLERAYHNYLSKIRTKANNLIKTGKIVFLELENGGRFGDGDEGFIWFDYKAKR